MPKNKKLALNSEIQTNQILTNDDIVCIPRLSSILLAAQNKYEFFSTTIKYIVIDVEQKDCGSNLNARNPVGLNSNKNFHKGTSINYLVSDI